MLEAGDVQGLDVGASCAFLGIPYASSTAGNNRWKPPQPVPPWASVLSATTPPATCTASEDCLKLNVWVRNTPTTGAAPVIVWLHTGGFIATSANFASSNGRRLAEETGVIVVAPNYRLGALGFLAHPALAIENPGGSAGNYGLLDQQAALRWVRDNIARFGGDPQNVTLAGTSAGGQSVGLQLVSPASEGLFHRAIVQSAYPTTPWRTAHEAAAQADALAMALSCTDPTQVVACMRSKPQTAVQTAVVSALQQVVEPTSATYWEPVVDGVVLPDQPRFLFESGAFHRVPTIIGFTRDEGWGNFITRSFPSGVSLTQYEAWVLNEFGPYGPGVLDLYPASGFVSPIEAMARVVGDAQFECEGRRLGRLIERTGTPTYLYSYEHVIDILSVDHVIHGVESNILFGNNYAPPNFPSYMFGPVEQTLHTAMAGYWTRFAARGNPNSDDETVAEWAPFKHPTGPGRGADKYIVFSATIGEGVRPREKQCDFFEPLFLRSLLGGVPAASY
jgi:para-nitrobenzyl esterase